MVQTRRLNAEVRLSGVTFRPGDTICGMLLVDTANDNDITTIEMTLFGSAKVLCKDKEFADFHHGQPLFLHNEKILIDRKAIVYQRPEPLLIDIDGYHYDNENLNGICPRGCHSDPSGLQAGNHGFPFEFHLPTNGIESSFSTNNCPVAIRYHIIVQSCLDRWNVDVILSYDQLDMASIMDSNNVVLMECSQPITIVKPSHASPSTSQSPNSVAKCIDLKKSYAICVSMKLARTCYKPTEPVSASITINNGWKGSLKYAHFNIVQRISYTAQLSGTSNRKTLTKDIDLTGVGLPPYQHKIPPGTSLSFSPQYYVPALLPTFEIADCMKVDYVARLTVGRSQNEIFGDLTIPLTIVTHIDGASRSVL